METISGADLLIDEITRGYRYRVALTPMGYLITARSRDLLGLAITEQWVHRTEAAARACVAAVQAGHKAWAANGTPQSGTALIAFQRASEKHTEACKRNNDEPLIGQEVRELRESMFPDDEPPAPI